MFGFFYLHVQTYNSCQANLMCLNRKLISMVLIHIILKECSAQSLFKLWILHFTTTKKNPAVPFENNQTPRS